MNIVFAGYVPTTGILVISQQSAAVGDPPVSLILSRDAAGDATLVSGDSGTQVMGGLPQPTPGLKYVNVQFLNNGHVFTIQDFDGQGAPLDIKAGQGAGVAVIKGASKFSSVGYSTKGSGNINLQVPVG